MEVRIGLGERNFSLRWGKFNNEKMDSFKYDNLGLIGLLLKIDFVVFVSFKVVEWYG